MGALHVVAAWLWLAVTLVSVCVGIPLNAKFYHDTGHSYVRGLAN